MKMNQLTPNLRECFKLGLRQGYLKLGNFDPLAALETSQLIIINIVASNHDGVLLCDI